jgi:hypothetical protein
MGYFNSQKAFLSHEKCENLIFFLKLKISCKKRFSCAVAEDKFCYKFLINKIKSVFKTEFSKMVAEFAIFIIFRLIE